MWVDVETCALKSLRRLRGDFANVVIELNAQDTSSRKKILIFALKLKCSFEGHQFKISSVLALKACKPFAGTAVHSPFGKQIAIAAFSSSRAP